MKPSENITGPSLGWNEPTILLEQLWSGIHSGKAGKGNVRHGEVMWKRSLVCWLVGFLTSSSTTRLYCGRAPRQRVWQFYVLPHKRQSWETMTSISAGHIILTPTQPVVEKELKWIQLIWNVLVRRGHSSRGCKSLVRWQYPVTGEEHWWWYYTSRQDTTWWKTLLENY